MFYKTPKANFAEEFEQEASPAINSAGETTSFFRHGQIYQSDVGGNNSGERLKSRLRLIYADWDHSTLTTGEMQVVVEEAHKQGLKVAAHAYTPDGIRNALNAGVDSIEHGNNPDRATLELMKQKNAYWVLMPEISGYATNKNDCGALETEKTITSFTFTSHGQAFGMLDLITVRGDKRRDTCRSSFLLVFIDRD